MRIAQVAPLHEAVPPKMYGGTERVVHYLTEELVRQGHELTLFASGDSKSSAQLIPSVDQALRLNPNTIDSLAPHILQIQQVMEMADEFDIIHFHIDYLHFPFSLRSNYAHVTTLHGRLDIPELKPLYETFPNIPVVSISEAQRRPLPMANFVANVYHGLPRDLYTFQPNPGKYLAFLGRVSNEKRLDRAIQIAIATDIPLKIAAKVDDAGRAYYESEIKPYLDHPLIEFIGEINDEEKNEFLGNALALLFPIDWPEPFGMVIIESFACGTPVIAFNHGSVPELISHGETGYRVNSIEKAIECVKKIDEIARFRCRQEFLNRFTVEQMASKYLSIYEQLQNDKISDKIPESLLKKTAKHGHSYFRHDGQLV